MDVVPKAGFYFFGGLGQRLVPLAGIDEKNVATGFIRQHRERWRDSERVEHLPQNPRDVSFVQLLSEPIRNISSPSEEANHRATGKLGRKASPGRAGRGLRSMREF